MGRGREEGTHVSRFSCTHTSCCGFLHPWRQLHIDRASRSRTLDRKLLCSFRALDPHLLCSFRWTSLGATAELHLPGCDDPGERLLLLSIHQLQDTLGLQNFHTGVVTILVSVFSFCPSTKLRTVKLQDFQTNCSTDKHDWFVVVTAILSGKLGARPVWGEAQ